MSKAETIEDFYHLKLNYLPQNLSKEMGHFNVFKLEDFVAKYAQSTPYNRKDFFKISLIIGRNEVHYADKTIRIDKQALFFANPQIPYNWEYLQEDQQGYFCIFTETFFNQFGNIKEYPIFKPGGAPIYFLTDEECSQIKAIFQKIMTEIESDYTYKYDVIRTLVYELIHAAMKMQPANNIYLNQTASTRIAALFTDLLERQFPIESPIQQMRLRAPIDFANQLSVHVNHLNRALKETTGKTTSQMIAARVMQEARALLKHTTWQIAEIGYCLGFEEPPHFINFFKKHTQITPKTFREAQGLPNH